MKILDMTAGNRAVWFNKEHPLCTYLDIRPETMPDLVCDTTNIPDSVGNDFDLIVYDPPHMNCGPNSNMSRVYGYFTTAQIIESIAGSGKEAARVSKPTALMALKWNSHDIRLQRVFDLLTDWEPLFGHLTKDGPRSQTYWVMLKKNG